MGKRKPVSLLTSLPSSLRKEILEKRLDEGKEVEAKDSVERYFGFGSETKKSF